MFKKQSLKNILDIFHEIDKEKLIINLIWKELISDSFIRLCQFL